ncbi:MAG: GNAT family N-acetyltransferase [Candidatus Saccharimonadales bacterium]
MTTETFPAAEQPESGEAERTFSVEVVTAYDPAIAAGIGRLMPQLDESFSSEPTSQDKLERIIASPDRGQLVGLDEQGNVVAAATMNTLMGAGKETEGWLEDFVVDQAARGTGLAEQMWQGMGDWCRSQGLSQFSFGTETWRPDAIKFYNRHGAVMDDTSRHLTYKLGQ